jgi:hypothetical protein
MWVYTHVHLTNIFMAEDNTNAEESILDESVSNYENSTEESHEDKQAESEVKVDSKFMTKTNQKLADQSKLNSLILRGKSPQDIKEEYPELAERLKRNKDFSDLFEDPEDPLDQEAKTERIVEEKIKEVTFDDAKRKAIASIVVDGKYLGSGDKKLLENNPEFKKRFDALVQGGFDPFEAAEDAFSKAYPKHAEKVSRTVLSGNSENIPYVKEGLELSEADRRLMKKFNIKEENIKTELS